jgi:hypothetical protein
MRNPAHEEAILASIEELNFCCMCGSDLNPERDEYTTCHDCERSMCSTCSGDCCASAKEDRLAHEAAATDAA